MVLAAGEVERRRVIDVLNIFRSVRIVSREVAGGPFMRGLAAK